MLLWSELRGGSVVANEFQKAITSALAQHIAARVPSLARVTPEWPNANTTLVYPSLTVLTVGEVRFIPLSSSLISQSAPTPTPTAQTKYLSGLYEPKLQLDLWAANKIQRAELFELIWRSINPNPAVMGVRIKLTGYFDEWASYIMDSYQFMDAEAGAQKQEWRCIMRVSALCNAIIDQIDPTMAQIVLSGEPTANYNEEF